MSTWLKILASASRARELSGRLSGKARTEKKQRAEFYRELWQQAAREIGATVMRTDGELLTISRGTDVARVFRNYTDLDGPVTLRAAGNKPLVHETLTEHGIPCPDFQRFASDDLNGAREFLHSRGVCVVKPAAGTGAGAGVTTGITTRRQLFKSAMRAAAYGPELLIEEQIPGHNVRLLFLDGCLLDAVQRQAPSVVGDGRSTIGQLVQDANRERRDRGTRVAQVFLKHDLDMKTTLAEQGLSWRDTPNSGQSVRLKTVINDNAAADNVSVGHLLCDQLIQTGRRAARAMGIRLAGVDIVTTDLTVDLSATNGVILEINTAPGLYIHQARQGTSVAVPILDACLNRSSPQQDQREQVHQNCHNKNQ